MFCVRWMFEALLKMNESASRLNQSFEIICIGRFGFEPKLLQDVMGLIIMLLVPALEVSQVKRVIRHHVRSRVILGAHQFRDQARNPLAFVHEGLNLVAAQAMSKRAGYIFLEGERDLFRVKE